jgi:hypothetical protein
MKTSLITRRAAPSFCLLAHITSSDAFSCNRQRSNPSPKNACALHATSTTTTPIEWKSCAQPKFDEFAECTVGPWIKMPLTTDGIKYEVDEVMRSCGGAVQGVRELPLHLVFPDLINKSDLRTYHNRADGGFVYANDGTYSAGPEQFDLEQADEDMEKLFMSSLSFGKHRLWLTSTLDSVLAASKQCTENETASVVSFASLELSRPTSKVESPSQQQNDIESITWHSIRRVRMPNISQPWSLARAKWQQARITTDEQESIEKGCTEGSLIGSTAIEFISESNAMFGDVIGEGFMVKMQALSMESKHARSTIRCYDKGGQLKSVAFLEGSLHC